QYDNTMGLYTTSLKDRNIMLQKSDHSWNLQQDASGSKRILFDMHMVLATKRMFQAETEFGQNKNSQLTKSEGASLMPMSDIYSKEQKGDQRLVLPFSFEKSISINNRELILSSDPYLISEIQYPYPVNEMQCEEQERYLILQDITSYTGTFRRPILTSDSYSMDEIQYQNQNFVPSSQKLHPAKGVLSVIYSEKAVQGSLVSNAFPNAHLANIAGVIRSLQTGDDMRHTSGLADQYNIHVYSSAPPQISTERSNPDTLWQYTYENSPISRPPLPE
ncbi:5567_t:CDS:2, partial [Diversispora eburnea]